MLRIESDGEFGAFEPDLVAMRATVSDDARHQEIWLSAMRSELDQFVGLARRHDRGVWAAVVQRVGDELNAAPSRVDQLTVGGLVDPSSGARLYPVGHLLRGIS